MDVKIELHVTRDVLVQALAATDAKLGVADGLAPIEWMYLAISQFQAIKEYRARTGMSLREAKDVIDAKRAAYCGTIESIRDLATRQFAPQD